MDIKEKPTTIEYTFELTMEEAFIVKKVISKMSGSTLRNLDIRFNEAEKDIMTDLFTQLYHCKPLTDYICFEKKYNSRKKS